MAASSPVQRMFWTKDRQIASVLQAMGAARDEQDKAEQRAVGERIRRLRDSHGWNQEELAHRMGVSSATISRWERGATGGQKPNLRKLAKVLGVALGDIQPPVETAASFLEQLNRIEVELAAVREVVMEIRAAQLAQALAQAGEAVEQAREAAEQGKRARGRRARGPATDV